MIKEQRREILRKKKRKRNMLILFALIILLVGIGVVLVTQVFTVKKVNVVGNELYTDEQIEEIVLSDEYSWSTLYVYLKYRFLRPEKLPFVDAMEVSLAPSKPHELTVEVYEKGILGYLYISSIDQNAYFDKDGFVVETSQEVIGDVPKIEGLSCDSVILYEKLPLANDTALKNLLSLTQLLQKYEIPAKQIKYEELSGAMTVYSGKITILVGNADNLAQKILRLQYILPQLEGKKGTLHLENWTSETTDIIFDPKKSKNSK
ncbi:MAG: cell division protein FtsQ/DivIB [bacterium]|nr:cell division protein FtsQ/DivIB [bacterium]MDY4098381.1 cell division protein FtsQ/DivIB [Lachnospiraceae bacterium]